MFILKNNNIPPITPTVARSQNVRGAKKQLING
jgi:hypothetical protein